MSTNNKWQALSMKDRAFLIREAVRNGITDINSIRDTWEHRFDGTKDNIPTEDKVSESYIHNFPYVRTALELPHQTEDDIQYSRQHFKYSPEFISQVQSGDYILSKMSNFSKNDSLVYTPLLERLDTYFKNRYDKEYNAQAPSEQEKVNQRYATWMIANMLEKKANPYNEKHKFINDKLTSLPDDEIDKLFNVTYYGPKASLIKGLKAKPKNITIPELIKMYKIMNQEYFHEKSDYNPLHQFSGEEPNIFTDTWDTIKGWFSKEEPKYITKDNYKEELSKFRNAFEEYHPKAYWDSKGQKWTVGTGLTYLIDDNGKEIPVRKGQRLSEAENQEQIIRRVNRDEDYARKKTPYWDKYHPELKFQILEAMYNAGNANVWEKSPKYQRALRKYEEAKGWRDRDYDLKDIFQHADWNLNDRKWLGVRSSMRRNPQAINPDDYSKIYYNHFRDSLRTVYDRKFKEK